MTDLTQAARQALEALTKLQDAIYNIGGEHVTGLCAACDVADAADRPIAALRAALEAQQEPVAHTSERHFALREAHAIGASDAYFKVWPIHDNDAGRMLFERGFVRGFDAGEKVYAHPPAQPANVEAQQEPFGWHRDGDAGCASHFHRGPTPPPPLSVERAVAEGWKPLYAHPPAPKEPQA